MINFKKNIYFYFFLSFEIYFGITCFITLSITETSLIINKRKTSLLKIKQTKKKTKEVFY